MNPDEEYKYYIRGYCKDELGIFDTEIQEVIVYDIPTNSNEDIPLEESLSSIDLDEELTSEQVLKRAESLAKATSDYDKNIEILNRTNVSTYSNRGILQEKLILYDPSGSIRDLFCNYRGNSYVIYYYLFCDCNGYEGTMCQIDKNSYDYVVDIYKKLLNKVKALQDNKYNKDLIKTIKLLMQSGATFMNIEHMDFMLESVEFINSQKDKFANKMIEGNNYELYFDIFNALIEYGLS